MREPKLDVNAALLRQTTPAITWGYVAFVWILALVSVAWGVW